MKKRFLAIGLSCVMLLGLLAGCGNKTNDDAEKAETPAETEETEPETPAETEKAETEAPEQGNDKKLIGINIALADNEFFQMVEYGLKKDFSDRGWEVLVTYGMAEKITENGATFLAQNVDAIVDFGCDLNFGNTLVQMAAEKDVPVVCIDVAYEGGYFFGANNDQAGTILGEAMADWINKHWDGQVDAIYEETNTLNSPVVALRTQNAVKALQNELGIEDDIVFQAELSQESSDGVKQKTVDYLSGNPDKEHVAYISMSMANLPPVIGGVETTGKSDVICFGTHSEERFIFDHFDTTPEEDDNVVGCVAYRPMQYGEYVGKMLEKLFKGETLEKETLMDHVVITRENYKEFQSEYMAVLDELKR